MCRIFSFILISVLLFQSSSQALSQPGSQNSQEIIPYQVYPLVLAISSITLPLQLSERPAESSNSITTPEQNLSSHEELIDLNDLITRLLKDEETEENIDFEIHSPQGNSTSLLLNNSISNYLPHRGRGIMGRYVTEQDEDGQIQTHRFYLNDLDVFHYINDVNLQVSENSNNFSQLNLLLLNPSLFTPAAYQNLDTLSTNEDHQTFSLYDDDLQIYGIYSRKYVTSSEEELSSQESSSAEMLQFEFINLTNTTLDNDSVALILYPYFDSGDSDFEVFSAPTFLKLKSLSFQNKHIFFARYKDLDQLIELIETYARMGKLMHLELGFHSNDEFLCMKHYPLCSPSRPQRNSPLQNRIPILQPDLRPYLFIRNQIQGQILPQTKIFLNGCETGSLKHPLSDNLVEIFARLFPSNDILGPIVSVSNQNEGEHLGQIVWAFDLVGVGSIPLTYRKNSDQDDLYRNDRERIHASFFSHSHNPDLNFIFFDSDQEMIREFDASLFDEFIDSINSHQYYYSKDILAIFMGHIYINNNGEIHVINPTEALIEFLIQNKIRVKEIHHLDFETELELTEDSSSTRWIHIENGYLTREYESDILSSENDDETGTESDEGFKRKREEDNSHSHKSKRPKHES